MIRTIYVWCRFLIPEKVLWKVPQNFFPFVSRSSLVFFGLDCSVGPIHVPCKTVLCRVRPTLLEVCLLVFSGLLGLLLGADASRPFQVFWVCSLGHIRIFCVFLFFWADPCSLQKGSVEGCPNTSGHLSPSLVLNSMHVA